jgi:hypothetical protein
MKVIFTVEAESEYDLRVYTQASAMWSTIWDFDQYLRNEIKYSENITGEQMETYDKIREKLHELLNENDVKLDL